MKNIRELRFIEEYCKDFVGSEAAKRAGYAPKCAKQTAIRLLKRQDICDEIERRRKAMTKKAEVSQERLLAEFLRLGLSNMGDFASWDAEGNVRVKASDELTRGQKAAIKKIESDRVTTVDQEGRSETRAKLKIELYPKEGPLTKLGEKYGLFPKAKDGTTNNIQVNNYHQANDPFDVAALSVEEQEQLMKLLGKAKPVTVVGEGKGE